MKTTLFPGNERGYANHGWLEAKHTFSFASWYNPERIHFGALRVLNDDRVAPGMGFSTHPHDNMEIITIPLTGKLRHRDNMGNEGVISKGEIQIMSAGTGVTHSEFNPDHEHELTLFQIWIFPNQRNVEPRYQQLQINEFDKKNEFIQLVSPNKDDEGGWIHQDAWITYLDADPDRSFQYALHSENSGLFVMSIDGTISINDITLNRRDALGITEATEITISTSTETQVLLLEVPLIF